MPEWRATYRLQLRPGFGFDEAAQIVDYLAELGISHLYLSPYLQAGPASQHGYDVLDHGKVNEQLGGAEAHQRLLAAMQRAGLGQLVDVVPNHMSIAGRGNAWWWDVLENGPASRFARYFDVDWDAPEQRLRNVILLPILPDHYGRVLESGGIRLFREGAAFTIRTGEHTLPVDPRSIAGLVGMAAQTCHSQRLAFLSGALQALPESTETDAGRVARRDRDRAAALELLAELITTDRTVPLALDAAVVETNETSDRLDALLDQQNYRLAWWQSAERDLDYRRFFDVNHLIGLCVEDEQVFRQVHRRVLEWVRSGDADGLRIDHPDGLKDPRVYLERLRKEAPDALVVVEKILAAGEPLRAEWPVQGTTGYDFLNLVNGLFVDPAAEAPLTRFYEEFTGESGDWPALARQKKLQVLREVLGSDVNRLAELMLHICEQNRRYRDYSRHQVTEALRELAASFPVYRTYIRPSEGVVEDEDRRLVEEAVRRAAEVRPDLDAELFAFVRRIMLLEVRGKLETEFVSRFQQLCAPAMAKGIEDTAFYVYNRFIALNEVGGDPSRFGVSPGQFHAAMAERRERQPLGLSSTDTHDTKRSLDVRARLSLLSVQPDAWAQAVRAWSRHNERHRGGDLPDRNMEYLYYQTLVGAWPIAVERLLAWAEKAAREAKTHTSWTTPDERYEKALKGFIEGSLADPVFAGMVEQFLQPLIPAGRAVSLAQTLIKITAPGTPDLYQGTELWSHALVDPDNRQPVDFALRRVLLQGICDGRVQDVWPPDDSGRARLWLVRRALAVRARHPQAFSPTGSYQPLAAEGPSASRVFAYMRGNEVIGLVPRLTLDFDCGSTTLALPAGRWRQVLADGEVHGRVPVAQLLRDFPVSLLERVR